MYEEAYLSNDADRESPYYCLFNNNLTREVPPCFIAGAEFDPLLDDSRVCFYQTLAAHQQPCRRNSTQVRCMPFCIIHDHEKPPTRLFRTALSCFTAQL